MKSVSASIESVIQRPPKYQAGGRPIGRKPITVVRIESVPPDSIIKVYPAGAKQYRTPLPFEARVVGVREGHQKGNNSVIVAPIGETVPLAMNSRGKVISSRYAKTLSLGAGTAVQVLKKQPEPPTRKT
jgi:hypothetical protein